MIVVIFNKPDFEYDVHSLLKEFFPQEDVQMYYSCPPEEVSGRNLACTHHEMSGDDDFSDADMIFKIDYVGSQITILQKFNENLIGSGTIEQNGATRPSCACRQWNEE